MAFATHLGPWLLGTVKNTTGTTAGTVRNTGATVVTQTFPLQFNTPAATRVFALPAGAMINEVALLTTTAFTGGATPSVSLNIGANTITNAISLGAVGRTSATLGAASAAAAAAVNNVGSVDALVTATVAGAPTAGSGTLIVQYVVRESDGSTAPTSFTA